MMSKNPFFIAVLLAVCSISFGCWKQKVTAVRVTGDISSNEQDCIRDGGHWERGGMMQHFVCIFSYSDGGKDCKSSAECESQTCIARHEQNNSGYCKHNSSPFGCYRTIEDAEINEPIICRD